MGIGHVGTTVARMADAFGLEVIATDPFLEPAEIVRRGARPASLDVTHEARRNIATMGSAQIVELLRGRKPPRLVNPEAWPAFEARFAQRAAAAASTASRSSA